MDGELLFWVLFFVGGYCLVLGVLLRIAFRKRPDADTGLPP
jgi:hypothetical protein